MSFLDGLLGSPNVSQATNSSVSAATGASLFLTAPSVVRTKSGQFKLSSSVCANLSGSTSGGISIQFFSSLTGAIGPTATGVGVNGSSAASIVWIDSPSINVGQSITYSVEVSPTNASTSITLPNKASSIVVAEEGGAPSGSGVIAVSTSGGGGGGGGGALSSLASPFTMPAVGSTVISAMIPGGGAAFQKNNAVNVNVSGAPSNFTVTLVSGDNVTLLNNGGPFNVAPTGMVPAASIVTVASTNAPLAASAPNPGQSLMIGLNGLYAPFGHVQVRSAWEFGVVGDGSHDDTTAVQASISAIISTGGVLYYPPQCNCKITSTITMDMSSSPFVPILILGAIGGGFPTVGSWKWAGTKGLPLFDMRACNSVVVQDMNFVGGSSDSNGATGASDCVRLTAVAAASSSGVQFLRCGVTSPRTAPYRVDGKTYVSGNRIIGPDTSVLLSSKSSPTDNGHMYICSVGGVAAAHPSAFNTGSGSSTTDGGVTWIEDGTSGAGINLVLAAGVQVSELTVERSVFTSCTAGFRSSAGSNIKNFNVKDCEFQGCGRGLDLNHGSGSMKVTWGIFANSLETDFFHGGAGTLIIDGGESEGSAMLLEGGLSGCVCRIDAFGEWAGHPFQTLNSKQYPIQYTGQLSIDCATISCSDGGVFAQPPPAVGAQVAVNVLMDGLGRGTSGSNKVSSLSMRNCTINDTVQFNVYDGSGNNYISNHPASLLSYQATDIALVLENNSGTKSDDATRVLMPNFYGGRMAFSLLQPAQRPGTSDTTTNAISPQGTVTSHTKMTTIPFTDFQAAATSITINVCAFWFKSKIKDLYIEVPTGFSGGSIATVTIEAGNKIPEDGSRSATTNAYIVASDCHSATAAGTPIGIADADRGTLLARATAVVGGAMVWGPLSGVLDGSQQWYLTLTMRSTGATLSALTAGSLNVFVNYDVYPGWQAGQTDDG